MLTYHKLLKLRYKNVFFSSGTAIILLSILIFSLSIISILIYDDVNAFRSFFLTFLISVFIGLFFKFLGKGEKTDSINIHDAVKIVFFIWTISIFVSAFPFFFSGLLSIHQSFFEATSGWTTTGLTMFSDVESLSEPFLIWRSLMQYFGGAGFALIMLVTARSTGVGLYQAEGRTDNLVPNFKDSIRLIIIIYSSYTIAGILLMVFIARVPFFHSFNNILTAIATGGFSTFNNSIAALDNLRAEIIIMIIMLVGATGFGVHFAFFQMIKNSFSHLNQLRKKEINKLELKEKFKREDFLNNPEPKTMFFIIFIFFIVILIFTLIPMMDIAEGVKHSLFFTISSITTTGHATMDISLWNGLGIFSIIILFILGGMMDSTAGGIKIFRIYVVLKVVFNRISLFFKPGGTTFHIEVRKGVAKKIVNDEILKDVISVCFAFFIILMIGVIILLAYGYEIEEALFEYTSALTSGGLSVGIVSTEAPRGVVWALIIGMYLGRLEFFAIFYAIIRFIKDIKEAIPLNNPK